MFAIVANVAFLYLGITNKHFGRKYGLLMLAFYVLYIVTIFFLQFGDGQTAVLAN